MSCARSHTTFTEQITRYLWWQYSTYGVRFPLIAKRLACMVTSSVTSPNSLDILSHVNLSHGIPADVSELVPWYRWFRLSFHQNSKNEFLDLSVKRVVMSSYSEANFARFSGLQSGNFFAKLSVQRQHEAWTYHVSWFVPVNLGNVVEKSLVEVFKLIFKCEVIFWMDFWQSQSWRTTGTLEFSPDCT